jgi:hypothetical protein
LAPFMARKAFLVVVAVLLACATLAAAGPVVVPVTPVSAYAAPGTIYRNVSDPTPGVSIPAHYSGSGNREILWSKLPTSTYPHPHALCCAGRRSLDTTGGSAHRGHPSGKCARDRQVACRPCMRLNRPTSFCKHNPDSFQPHRCHHLRYPRSCRRLVVYDARQNYRVGRLR